MKTEIELLITKPMTLRKFYNAIKRAIVKSGQVFDLDWDDFKRWEGNICEGFSGEEYGGEYKRSSEFNDGSCYFYLLNVNY